MGLSARCVDGLFYVRWQSTETYASGEGRRTVAAGLSRLSSRLALCLWSRVPRQQFGETLPRDFSAMRVRTSASQACGSMLSSFAVTISEYMNAACWLPRSEPANSHDFLPNAIPRRAFLAKLFVRQMRPSVRNSPNASQSSSIYFIAFAMGVWRARVARCSRSYCWSSATSGMPSS